MQLFNTLTRQLEPVKSLNNDNLIRFYACGPTVYDYTHIGHLRRYVMDDVLIRALKANGFKVKHVMNITDVGHLTSDDDSGEDKLEKGAKKFKLSVWDLADKFSKYFWHSLDKMGVNQPDIVARVTDHIPEQIELIKKLEAKNFTYIIKNDGLYFDTSKLDDYGKLAKLDIKNLKAGARVDIKGKKNITDFALWKFEKEGENRQMSWPSPWAKRGFPGWHIECSALGIKYLGEQFELHSGGIDHIPVHHTNEIAQSEAATGKKPFVKIWLHHNFMLVDGQKMSKSLNNFLKIEEVIKKGFNPQALRLLFLGAHYRSELNFTWENLAGAQKAWERLRFLISNFKTKTPKKQNIKNNKYYLKFKKYINHDLDTPQAVALMWEVVKDDALADSEKYDLLLAFDKILGLGLGALHATPVQGDKKISIPDNIKKLLTQRQQARDNQDWAKADELRDQIQDLGFKIEDSGNEQKLVKI